MSFSRVNATYLQYLIQYPLLTKSVTSGVLNGLNETIASIISGDYQSFKLSPKSKVFTMMFYGSVILTPVSHNMYAVLNKIFGGQTSAIMKVLQILTSLTTITPTLSAIFTSWVAIINNYTPSAKSGRDPAQYVAAEARNLFGTVKKGLQQNYPRVLKGSMTTSLVSLVIAQKFIKPELWVVFFNLVYFVLGTYQNTKMKIAAKRLRDQKLDEKKSQ